MCAYTRSHAHWSWCLSQNRIRPCACAPSRVCQIAIHKSYAVLMHMTDTNNTFFGRSKCPCRCDNKSPPSVRLLRNPITDGDNTFHSRRPGSLCIWEAYKLSHPYRNAMQVQVHTTSCREDCEDKKHKSKLPTINAATAPISLIRELHTLGRMQDLCSNGFSNECAGLACAFDR